MTLKIGLAPPTNFWTLNSDTRREMVAAIADAGIDHLFMADHVSFHDGAGTDGFVEIAALSQLHATIGVMISIYLLPLRHPLPVARQLATMHKIAPGRMLFGVGIGGEDRHEVEVCGVNPATRGKRTNEMLPIIRALMRGESVSVDGEFFEINDARINPTIDPPIPIIIGGRSDAALVRTGRFGDGWIATWCSVDRFKQAQKVINEAALNAGRENVQWLHGYQPWIGVADTRAEARELVAREMESFYKVPFEKFEKYTPYGTPAEVAGMLSEYVEAGCSIMNMKIVAGTDAEEIAAASEISRLLR